MANITLLLLLSLASVAVVWAAGSRDSAPKTCTPYASTEEIIKARKKVVGRKTKDRAPVCTNVFSFTYVQPGSSMTFNSHVKKWKTPNSVNCGLWFWTDNGYMFDLKCSRINVRKDDTMVIYNIDTNDMKRITETNKGAYFSFKSINLVVNLEMKLKRRTPSYCCEITAVVLPKPKRGTYIVAGYDFNKRSNIRNVDLISDGKVTSLPHFPVAVRGNGAVVYDNKLYSCGGYKNGKNCYSLDLVTIPLTWKRSIFLPVSISYDTMMAVGDNLWILQGTYMYVVPFKSGSHSKHKLPSGLNVGHHSCGGGNELYRFVIPASSTHVWINTNPKKPGEWTNKATLANGATDKIGCMIKGDDIYVAGGSKWWSDVRVAERVSLTNYKVHRLGNLLRPRRCHAMGLINDDIAIFAGYNSVAIDTVEVYKAAGDKWTNSLLKLTNKNTAYMGYVTIY